MGFMANPIASAVRFLTKQKSRTATQIGSPAISKPNQKKRLPKRPVTFRPNLTIGLTLSYFLYAPGNPQCQMFCIDFPNKKSNFKKMHIPAMAWQECGNVVLEEYQNQGAD